MPHHSQLGVNGSKEQQRQILKMVRHSIAIVGSFQSGAPQLIQSLMAAMSASAGRFITSTGGMLPAGPDYQGPRSFYEFLVKLPKEGEHDQAFAYKTSNAEVLAWIVKRASGMSLARAVQLPAGAESMP